MTKTSVYFMEAVIEIAESLDWNVDYDDRYVTFQRYSSAEQDFNMTIDLTENFSDFCQSIYEYYDSYDPSEEASYWLDETGHGTNGAPYRMIDVYNDMVECEEKVLELWRHLYNSDIPETAKDFEED